MNMAESLLKAPFQSQKIEENKASIDEIALYHQRI
jgi:hypothetical protein